MGYGAYSYQARSATAYMLMYRRVDPDVNVRHCPRLCGPTAFATKRHCPRLCGSTAFATKRHCPRLCGPTAFATKRHCLSLRSSDCPQLKTAPFLAVNSQVPSVSPKDIPKGVMSEMAAAAAVKKEKREREDKERERRWNEQVPFTAFP